LAAYRQDERRIDLGQVAVQRDVLGLADQAFVYDNSVASLGIQLQAQLVDQRLEFTTDRPAEWVRQLVTRVNERADELARIDGRASELGLALQAARLNGGRTEGPIEILGEHYAAQQDPKTKVLVLHDRSLLPDGQRMEQGTSYRIQYGQGVGKLEAVAQTRVPEPAAPSAKPPRDRE
jgi:hypothetical protein